MLQSLPRPLALMFALVAGFVLGGGPLALHAQERLLARPNAVLPGDFSQIRGVRELADGRVLVTDRVEERLVVADFTTGKQTSIGRTGTGPGEFHLPTRLTAMPGDSTLLVDEGNSRLAVISPALRIVRSFNLRVPGIGYTLGSRGMDVQGRWYIEVPGWMIDAYKRGDTVPVLRFDPRAQRVDTVALVKGATSLPPDVPKYGLSFIAFSSQDVWAMTTDGRVAVVRSRDYRVEWREADGRIVRGAPIPFTPIRVTGEDRTSYARNFLINSPVGGRGEGGGLGLVPSEWMTDAAIREFVERNPFAKEKGAFTSSTPLVAADGSLWVERSVAAGTAPLWEVLDRTGRPVARYRLTSGRRLVALGRAFVYVVATDDDGIEHLERYRLAGAP